MVNCHLWPGNVRALRNTLEGMIVLSMNSVIQAADLLQPISNYSESQADIKPAMTMAQIEKEAIRRTLDKTGGNRTLASRIVEISRRTRQRKIYEYDLG